MVAMQRWIDEQRTDPQGIDGEVLEEFSVWVEERLAVAGNTAVLHRESNRAW